MQDLLLHSPLQIHESDLPDTSEWATRVSATHEIQDWALTTETELTSRSQTVTLRVTEFAEPSMNLTDIFLHELIFPNVHTKDSNFGNNTGSPKSLTFVLAGWGVIMIHIQSVISALGCVANILTLITFQRYRKDWGEKILLILTNQSTADALVCLSSVLTLFPQRWTTGSIHLTYLSVPFGIMVSSTFMPCLYQAIT